MSMQMPPTGTLPHPWGEGREGVIKAHPLEQPVCQRSTGMSSAGRGGGWRGARELITNGCFLRAFWTPDPPRQPPISGGGEGGEGCQDAISIWRQSDPPSAKWCSPKTKNPPFPRAPDPLPPYLF